MKNQRPTKADCESAIRSLSREFAATLNEEQRKHPSYLDFKAWLGARSYSRYLDFKSRAGPDYDAELWFDQELGQSWRR